MVGYGEWRDGDGDLELRWVICKTGGHSFISAVSEARLTAYVRLGSHSAARREQRCALAGRVCS